MTRRRRVISWVRLRTSCVLSDAAERMLSLILPNKNRFWYSHNVSVDTLSTSWISLMLDVSLTDTKNQSIITLYCNSAVMLRLFLYILFSDHYQYTYLTIHHRFCTLLLPSCRKLEFRLSALMDSDLAWVNGKSGRQSWCYADTFQRSMITGAVYHLFYHLHFKLHRILLVWVNFQQKAHDNLRLCCLPLVTLPCRSLAPYFTSSVPWSNHFVCVSFPVLSQSLRH